MAQQRHGQEEMMEEMMMRGTKLQEGNDSRGYQRCSRPECAVW
jgi:hypothetical protein